MRSGIVGPDKSGQLLAHQQMALAGAYNFFKKKLMGWTTCRPTQLLLEKYRRCLI
jgi:hypothetical protein